MSPLSVSSSTGAHFMGGDSEAFRGGQDEEKRQGRHNDDHANDASQSELIVVRGGSWSHHEGAELPEPDDPAEFDAHAFADLPEFQDLGTFQETYVPQDEVASSEGDHDYATPSKLVTEELFPNGQAPVLGSILDIRL